MIILPPKPQLQTRKTMHDIVINDLASTIPHPSFSIDMSTFASYDGSIVSDMINGTTCSAYGSPVMVGNPGSQSQDTYLAGNTAVESGWEADSTPAVFNSFHKAGATASFAFWYYHGVGDVIPIFSTAHGLSQHGSLFVFRTSPAPGLETFILNGSGGSPFRNAVFGSTTPISNSWNFLGYSSTLPAGTGSYTVSLHCNARVNDNIIVTSTGAPSSSDSTNTPVFGSDRAGAQIMSNAAKIGAFMAWDNVHLTTTQYAAIKDTTKSFYGVA